MDENDSGDEEMFVAQQTYLMENRQKTFDYIDITDRFANLRKLRRSRERGGSVPALFFRRGRAHRTQAL